MGCKRPAFQLANENIFQQIMHRAKGRDGVVSLAIGDHPGPIVGSVLEELQEEAIRFATPGGHKGYPPEEGSLLLKEWINEVFYNGRFSLEEIFISDGIKTDLFRLQTLFGPQARSSYFAPAYPTYAEGCHIIGAPVTPVYLEAARNFIPDCSELPNFDVFYLCSPNNPTAVAYTQEQWEQLAESARKNQGVLVHDACYSPYIQSLNCPKTIYFSKEMESVGIELGSFSKWGAMSGIRLSWSVVPKQLRFADGESVHDCYKSFLNATYNGVSWLSQRMGVALLQRFDLVEKGIQKVHIQTEKLRTLFENLGFRVFGGVDGPYLVVETNEDLLEEYGILTLPLQAFAPEYQGFNRVSGFVSEEILEIVTTRLQNSFQKP